MRQLPVGLPGLMNTNARQLMPLRLASTMDCLIDSKSRPHPYIMGSNEGAEGACVFACDRIRHVIDRRRQGGGGPGCLAERAGRITCATILKKYTAIFVVIDTVQL